MRKRSKCWWTSQQAGGPPKPVAKPTVPSVASISTRKEPRTLMPQVVREERYFSQPEQGVEMGLSMSLKRGCQTKKNPSTEAHLRVHSPVATLDIVVVAAFIAMSVCQDDLAMSNPPSAAQRGIKLPEPTPLMTKDRTALILGNSRIEDILGQYDTPHVRSAHSMLLCQYLGRPRRSDTGDADVE